MAPTINVRNKPVSREPFHHARQSFHHAKGIILFDIKFGLNADDRTKALGDFFGPERDFFRMLIAFCSGPPLGRHSYRNQASFARQRLQGGLP
jgi:hypothetical protein